MSDRVIGYPVINIATPHDKLLCWTAGQDRQNVARLASDYNITYIPVRENGRITGLVTRASLGSDPEPVIQPLTADWLIAADTPILKVIELFAANPDRVFLVLQASDIVGLVAPADLNKIPTRASVYQLLAEFETNLGNLIREALPNEQAYSKYLPERLLNNFRKRRNTASKNDLDTDLLSYMDLRALITIAVQDRDIRQRLGFESDDDAGESMPSIDVRNSIGHPVKQLTSRRGLKTLNETCQRLFDMNDRLAMAHEQVDLTTKDI